MSYPPEWAPLSPYPAHPPLLSTSEFARKLVITAVILILGGVGLSLLDSWPSITKRLIWEVLVFLSPARLIYAVEYAMVKYKRLPGEEPMFRPEHFRDRQAKVEALQRILRLDESRFVSAFKRVRALSGINRMIGGIQASLPPGLGNWDNSCYQNSILQGLASLPAFRNFICGNLEGMTEQDESFTHHALSDIMGQLNEMDGYAGTLWTPSVLKSMDSWQQQDAQEYFSKLTDTVDQELSKSIKRRKLKSAFEVAAQTLPSPGLKSLPLSNPLEGLLAQRVACKQCGLAEGLSLMPFNCLTINMGRQHEYDLEELLDEHTALENIEGVECVKCTLLHVRSQLERLLSDLASSDTSEEFTDASKRKTTVETRLRAIQKVFEDDSFSESGILKRCNISAKNHVSSVKSKQVALARPPKSLVIHINRSIFDDFGNQKKNTASVHFPAAFDLSRWCLGVKSSSPDVKEFEHWSMTSTESMLPLSEKALLDVPTVYELRCVVTHYGRHENGHYVAYGRRQPSLGEADPGKHKIVDEQWYCFNDEVVTPVSEEDVLARGNAFMLFYEAVKQPQIHLHANITDKQTVLNAPMDISPTSSGECTEESREFILDRETAAEKDTSGSTFRGQGAVFSSVQQLEGHEQGENEPTQSDEVPNGSLKPVTGGPSLDNPPAVSGLTPVMRTSSVSPTLSRMEKHESSFAMPSSAIISAM